MPKQSASLAAAGGRPELFSLPTSSQKPSSAAQVETGAAHRTRHSPCGQSRGRNPNILGQHGAKTTVWNLNSLLKIKPQQSGSLEGLGHSAETGNGSCDWAEALWGTPGQGPKQGQG